MIISERKLIKKSSLLDIDMALFDLFDKKINVFIEDGKKKRKKVNVVYGTGERWAQVKNKKKLRDSKNALILPIISIRRTDFEKVQDMWALGRFQKYISFAKILNKETSNRANLFDARRRNNKAVKAEVPVYEVYQIPYPTFVKVNYEVQIWTNYIVDMNIILEKVWAKQNDSAAGSNQIQIESPQSGNKYIVLLDQSITNASNIEEFTEDERIIKSVLNYKVLGYLVDEGDIQGMTKSVPCVSEITLDESVIQSPEEIEKIFK